MGQGYQGNWKDDFCSRLFLFTIESSNNKPDMNSQSTCSEKYKATHLQVTPLELDSHSLLSTWPSHPSKPCPTN